MRTKPQKLALGIMNNPRFRFRSKAMIGLGNDIDYYRAPGYSKASSDIFVYRVLISGPVIDNDFFPKPLDELRKKVSPKRFINGVTEFEGLLFSVGSLESNHHPLIQSAATFFMRTVLSPSSFFGRHLFKRILAKKNRQSKHLMRKENKHAL